MARSDMLRIALAAVVALGIGAVVGAVSMSQERPGLPVGDLSRIGTFSDAPPAVADHTEWSFGLFTAQSRITDDDLRDRFTLSFSAGFTADALNSGIDDILAMFGPVRFVRYEEADESSAFAIGVAAEGKPFVMPMEIAPDGRMAVWGLGDMDSPPRLPGWQGALALLAMWLAIIAAFVVRRTGGHLSVWVLVGLALTTGSVVLTLSDAPAAYSLGRSMPALAIVPGAWLLLRSAPARERLWLTLAAGGALVLASAPATRDPALVGHPDVLWGWADSATTYRVLLVLGSVIAAAALFGIAFGNATRLRNVGRWRRSPIAAAAVVAVAWGIALLGGAIDYLIGEGVFATGPLTGVSLGCLIAVPPVIAFHTATAHWDQPELADLVVELGGGDLQNAVAAALEDPEVRVLSSPDGRLLVDGLGVEASDELPIARITKDGDLIGGLLLGEDSQHHPERLHAVTAAVGMALELRSLNQQVVSQLEEVAASRARIVEASDAARRQVERDLHDGAQQQLVALGLDLQRARRLAAAEGSEEIETILDSATQALRDTIADIRSVARGADPPLLTERGLAAAVDALVERCPVPVSVEITGSDLTPATARTAYYVIAESLTNVAKHSEATSAEVRVISGLAAVTVEVRDNGAGGASVIPRGGLQGLRDRTAAANGSFHVSSDQQGTLVRAVVPCA